MTGACCRLATADEKPRAEDALAATRDEPGQTPSQQFDAMLKSGNVEVAGRMIEVFAAADPENCEISIWRSNLAILLIAENRAAIEGIRQ